MALKAVYHLSDWGVDLVYLPAWSLASARSEPLPRLKTAREELVLST